MRNLHGVTSPAALCVLLGFLAVSGSTNAHDEHQNASDWMFTLGAGVLTTPNYTGDDLNQLILAPLVRATDGAHWSIGFLEGMQYTINRNAIRAHAWNRVSTTGCSSWPLGSLREPG